MSTVPLVMVVAVCDQRGEYIGLSVTQAWALERQVNIKFSAERVKKSRETLEKSLRTGHHHSPEKKIELSS